MRVIAKVLGIFLFICAGGILLSVANHIVTDTAEDMRWFSVPLMFGLALIAQRLFEWADGDQR